MGLVSNIIESYVVPQLMEVLDRSDLVDVISWMPHGRAFVVKKPKLFAVDVLPRFFKQTKYLSFTRQLNLWGFKRITKGLDGGAYYHELFLRGRPYLAMRMKRHKVKGTGIKLTPNPSMEPLFYRDYPYMEQLDETRAIAPLPPLPPDRVVLPDKETSLDQGTSLTEGAPVGSASMVRPAAAPGQQSLSSGEFPQLSHAAAMQNIMGTPHPFLAGSRGGLGDMSSFLPVRQPHYAGEGYGGLAGMSGMRGGPLTQTPGAMLGGASRSYPSMNPTSNYENVLFAPGVTWGSVAASGQRVNDPIQDELTAMIRNRQSQTTSTADMFPSQNLTSDRLLLERLRDVDRAAQLKREQQDISMLGKGGAAEGASAFTATGGGGPGHANFAFSGPSISNGLGNGPFDRYRHISLQSGAMGFGSAYSGALASSSGAATVGQGTQNIDEEQQAVESSVKEALREANHLEELALAQRAKARNIALAGALSLSSRGGGVAPPQAQSAQPTPTTEGASKKAEEGDDKGDESQSKDVAGLGQCSAV